MERLFGRQEKWSSEAPVLPRYGWTRLHCWHRSDRQQAQHQEDEVVQQGLLVEGVVVVVGEAGRAMLAAGEVEGVGVVEEVAAAGKGIANAPVKTEISFRMFSGAMEQGCVD